MTMHFVYRPTSGALDSVILTDQWISVLMSVLVQLHSVGVTVCRIANVNLDESDHHPAVEIVV